MRKKVVYVAGPYTKPDPVLNTQAAVDLAEKLVAAGYTPIVPHLCHLWHLISPHSYTYWVELSAEWLRLADAILVLPGESLGTLNEVELAKTLGIPIYQTISQVKRFV